MTHDLHRTAADMECSGFVLAVIIDDLECEASMIYRQGERHNIPRLKVTQVTSYLATIHHDQDIVKWRYAFVQEQSGLRFVYTGQLQSFKEGDELDLRGTIKREVDRFGYIRLARIKRVSLQPELDL